MLISGGTAGNTVANRLTENGDISVLVLEAGLSWATDCFSVILIISHFFACRNEGVLNSIVPFFAANLVVNNPFVWNFTTVPQPGLNDRSIIYPRGFILGGTSSISEHEHTLYSPMLLK